MFERWKKRGIKQIQDVSEASWSAAYEGIIPIEIQRSFLESASNDEMMNKRLALSSLYVAELGAIYLYPEHQGNGIGTGLL